MFKRVVIFIGFSLLFCINTLATPLWHCTAFNDQNASWDEYGETQADVKHLVETRCEPFNLKKYCRVTCFPPRIHWRCLSHDAVPPALKSTDVGKDAALATKPGVCYWTSFSKQIAINGARDACRHNSGLGGCHVNPDSCSQS